MKKRVIKGIFSVLFATLFCVLSVAEDQPSKSNIQSIVGDEAESIGEGLLPYLDSSLSVEERVEDLLSRMTLVEKVAQVSSLSIRESVALEEGTSPVVRAVKDGILNGIGQIENTFDLKPAAQSVSVVNSLQRMLKEKTRLGIPALIGSECLHGHAGYNSTVLPSPLAMASSWNTDLVNRAFMMVGAEARVRGSHEAHTPVLDLGRDPRWGRIEETYGEDTYLVTQMGLSVTQGLQGGSSGIPGPESIISAPKHFAGYGQVAGGRNFAATEIDSKTLFDDVLPPFEAAVKQAKVQGMMASHCDVDGIPAHGNRWLLTELLREQWGFEGYVVSDYSDVPRLSTFQNIVETIGDAAALALYAGVDMDLPVGDAYKQLDTVIAAKPELIDSLDTNVRRVLRLKFLLGLFENPFADAAKAEMLVGSDEHVELALDVACESVVMLKNEADVLPLKKDELKRIAVIGPKANSKEIGNYTVKNDHVVSILDGLKQAVNSKTVITFEQGCSIPTMSWRDEQRLLDEIPLDQEIASIERAVESARNAEVAIVCVGGDTKTSKEAFFRAGVNGDRATLGLVGNQKELVLRVVETGTPTVVILMGGRPLSINEISEKADAILNTFYLGQTNGVAVSRILFGEVNPSGKLPVTIPRSVGQLPVYYSQKKISFFKEYLDEQPGPLYPFGFGLSYTTFEYSDFKIETENVSMDQPVKFSVKIRNTGSVAGAEIAQVYFRDCVASVIRPDRKLIRFEKVYLEAGEERELLFVLEPRVDLSFTGANQQRIVEPGAFDLMIGSSSNEIHETGRFTLTK